MMAAAGIGTLLASGCLGASVWAAWSAVDRKSDLLGGLAVLYAIGTGVFGILAIAAVSR